MFKRKETLIVLWLTFITTVAWIGFSIYHIIVTSTISEELQLQITPINPNFDMDTIIKLKDREKVEPLYQFNDSPASASASNATDASPTTDSPLPQGSDGQAGSGTVQTVEGPVSPTESTLPPVTGAP